MDFSTHDHDFLEKLSAEWKAGCLEEINYRNQANNDQARHLLTKKSENKKQNRQVEQLIPGIKHLNNKEWKPDERGSSQPEEKRQETSSANQPQLRFELYLSDLLSQVFEQPLLAIISGRQSRFQATRSWFYLLDDAKFELALDLSGLCGIKTEIAYFMEIVRLAALFRNHFARDELVMIRSFSQATPLFEQQFLVIDKDNPQEPLGEVYCAAPMLDEIIRDYDTSREASALLKHQVKLELLLLYEDITKCRQGSEISVPARSTHLYLSVMGALAECFYPVSYNCWGQGIVLSVEESIMDEIKKSSFPCQLSLGEIGLSMDDVLDLRPGSVVEFKKPENWQGSLQIGSSEWARVAIDIRNDQLVLTVEEVAAIDALKKRS